jgi:hypothetical protein
VSTIRRFRGGGDASTLASQVEDRDERADANPRQDADTLPAEAIGSYFGS